MLKEIYQKEVVPALKEQVGGGNAYGVPAVKKVVVNMGVGALKDDREGLEKARGELAALTGQTPSTRRARRAIASFNLKRGEPVGLVVTLRGAKMWDFLEKLVKIVLPRTRDFKGLTRKSLDGNGNLTVGITEHSAFPEVDPHKVARIYGLEVTVATSTKDNDKAYQVLKALGVPFRD